MKPCRSNRNCKKAKSTQSNGRHAQEEVDERMDLVIHHHERENHWWDSNNNHDKGVQSEDQVQVSYHWAEITVDLQMNEEVISSVITGTVEIWDFFVEITHFQVSGVGVEDEDEEGHVEDDVEISGDKSVEGAEPRVVEDLEMCQESEIAPAIQKRAKDPKSVKDRETRQGFRNAPRN